MKASKAIAYAIAAIPVLFIGQCMYREVAHPRKLAEVCDAAKPGVPLQKVLDHAATHDALKVRTGGAAGKNDSEWFDRQYLRTGEYLRKTKNITDDYSVAFAKPGVGYHACIITHAGGVVKSAWFEDRSN